MQKQNIIDECLDIEGAWSELIMSEFATENELILITKINGYKMETMEDVLYARTGLTSFEQLEEEEED